MADLLAPAGGTTPLATGPTSVAGGPASNQFWRRYGWIITRLGLAVLTLVLVSMLVFAATVLLPGDAAQVIAGRNALPEVIEAVRQKLGLDQPPVIQYVNWALGALTGDFGDSLITRTAVFDTIAPRVVNSLILVAFTGVIAIPLALVIGISSAVRPGKAWDTVVNTVSIVLAGLPEFVIALLLVVTFSTGLLHWFPAVVLLPQGTTPLSNPAALVLPVATLVIVALPYLVRQVRASLVENLSAEYVVMAELKGLPERIVILRHALRNSLIPSIQAAALTFAYLIGGTVVVEFLFQYPGMGFALTNAVQQRDVPVIQFIVLVMALAYIVFNLLADILTVLVTPKLRTR